MPQQAQRRLSLVPLVEFRFGSPGEQITAATMNPGFACVAVTWQFAGEGQIAW
jgi:hypothetical protein